MKLKITKNNEEELLSRSSIEADMEFDAATPARKDVLQKIAESISVEPDLVVVTNINVTFGTHKAKVYAYAYKNKEERNRIEEKKILVKRGFNIPKIEKKVVVAQ